MAEDTWVFYRDRETDDYVLAEVVPDRQCNDRDPSVGWLHRVVAVAVQGRPETAHPCKAVDSYLKKKCRRVARRNVPETWRNALEAHRG